MDAAQFSALMNRFYAVATSVLIESHAYLDKFVGDEVVGIYLPAFAGQNHAARAVRAARDMLRLTGHEEPKGPWIPIGVGVHSGPAYFGTVKGSEDTLTDLTALGDSVNVAARLAQNARAGEALISEAAARSADLHLADLSIRKLRLKGKSQPQPVRVITTQSAQRRTKRAPTARSKPARKR